jgi:hypothetical protein
MSTKDMLRKFKPSEDEAEQEFIILKDPNRVLSKIAKLNIEINNIYSALDSIYENSQSSQDQGRPPQSDGRFERAMAHLNHLKSERDSLSQIYQGSATLKVNRPTVVEESSKINKHFEESGRDKKR